MRPPRGPSGRDPAKALERHGYEITRRTGSRLRLTTRRRGEHHVTVPAHGSVRVGTLSGIIGDVAEHLGMGRDEIMRGSLRLTSPLVEVLLHP